ncbi:hypothetical protein ATCC90586_005284 [Pythium insidiosum]|nr:hypothetical protein ATCC90586_005284 [Pythium insidiosum]
MGAAHSSAGRSERSASVDDDSGSFFGDSAASSLDQVWISGVPFTLLHDEAFVAEKYDELQRSHGRRQNATEEDEALQMTGTDELPLDELEQMTDLARIKLFTRHRARVNAADAAAGQSASTRSGF